MKIYFFIIALFCVTDSFAQSKDEIIRSIRAEFQVINTDTTLTRVVLNNEEFLEHMTDGGGMLTGFYKDKRIKKIVQWVGISHGVDIREYYFKDDKVIFVYIQFKSFVYDEKKGTLDLFNTTITSENRYYFNDGKLISRSGKEDNTLLTEAADLRRMLSQKK